MSRRMFGVLIALSAFGAMVYFGLPRVFAGEVYRLAQTFLMPVWSPLVCWFLPCGNGGICDTIQLPSSSLQWARVYLAVETSSLARGSMERRVG